MIYEKRVISPVKRTLGIKVPTISRDYPAAKVKRVIEGSYNSKTDTLVCVVELDTETEASIRADENYKVVDI